MSDDRTTSQPHFISPTGELVVSIACVNCRYDLKGLKIAANCPECGMPIVGSLPKGNLLSVEQMQRIGHALTVIILSSVCLYISLLLGTAYGNRQPGYLVAGMLAVFALAIARTWACFRMTRSDTLPRLFANIADHRRTLRVLTILSTAFWGLAMVAACFAAASTFRPERSLAFNLGMTCAGIATLFSAGGAVVVLSIAERIADLLSAHGLSSTLRVTTGACIVVGAIGLIFLIGPALAWLLYIGALVRLRHELLRRSPT